MVTLKIKLPIEPERREEFVETSRCLLEPIKFENGCIDCRLLEDVAEPDCLLLEQEWRDESLMNQHIHGQRFRSLMVLMDMLSGPPEIFINSAKQLRIVNNIQQLFDIADKDNRRTETVSNSSSRVEGEDQAQ